VAESLTSPASQVDLVAGGAPVANGRWLAAALRLDEWMRQRDYAGYDPHDLLSAAPVRALTFGNRLLGVAWTQLGKRSPVQFRPLVGVPRVRNAKGIGLVLAAHTRLFEATGDHAYAESAASFVGWLGRSAWTDGESVGWGYPFPWSNRSFNAPAGTPASVPTAFIAHALLDAAERLPPQPWSAAAAGLAVGAGHFLSSRLNRVPGDDGAFSFSYTPLDHRAVHNANLLTASVLARLAAVEGAGAAGAGPGAEVLARWTDDVVRATRFTLGAQRADGSWPYGTGGADGWVDSFHTSYMLVSLQQIATGLQTAGGHDVRDIVPAIEEALEGGLQYWRSSFFDGPAIGFHPHRPWPVDVHAVAHAVLTFVELEGRMPDGIPEARRLAEWCLTEMQDPDGYFYYQKHRFYRNRLAYMRWTQAWMLLALARLAARVDA
jgi:hypothetical protein